MKQFPAHIFPEMLYEPLYLDELDATLKASITPPQVRRSKSFLQLVRLFQKCLIDFSEQRKWFSETEDFG